jgi:hypothetical protein
MAPQSCYTVGMKVGDLISLSTSANHSLLALVVKQDAWATLICWFDGEPIEDISNYDVSEFEVISEGR